MTTYAPVVRVSGEDQDEQPGSTPSSGCVPPNGPEQPTVRVKLPLGDVARATLVLIGLIGSVYVLWRIQEVLFLLMLGILLATAIEPIVNRLRRGPFNRGSGVLVIYSSILLIIGTPTFILAPSIGFQANAFMSEAPREVGRLKAEAAELRPRPLQQAVVVGLDQLSAELKQPQAPGGSALVAASYTAVRTVIDFIMVFVIALYWLVERASLKRHLLRIVPRHRARDVNLVWVEVEEKLGAWVRGQLVVMLMIGVLAGIGYFYVGLPSFLLLAVLAGLFEFVPILGPFLAFAPGVVVALTISPKAALIVLAYAIVVQQIEGNVLVPRIMSYSVGVSPLTVLLGILAGASLYGIPGALLAVPVAGAIQVVLAHLLHNDDTGPGSGAR